MLFIAPLFFALASFGPTYRIDAVDVLRSTLLWTLFGASVALLTVGLKIATATPKSGATSSH
jgi:hypothetical protein